MQIDISIQEPHMSYSLMTKGGVGVGGKEKKMQQHTLTLTSSFQKKNVVPCFKPRIKEMLVSRS